MELLRKYWRGYSKYKYKYNWVSIPEWRDTFHGETFTCCNWKSKPNQNSFPFWHVPNTYDVSANRRIFGLSQFLLSFLSSCLYLLVSTLLLSVFTITIHVKKTMTWPQFCKVMPFLETQRQRLCSKLWKSHREIQSECGDGVPLDHRNTSIPPSASFKTR